MADEWFSRLRTASFRGVPFAVEANERVVGRRQAVHEYPDRDDSWSEDMGRATRRIRLRGFLVEHSAIYGGGSVIAQQARLEAAAEAAGPGLLVHPTRGPLTVSCVSLTIAENLERGRAASIEFTFLQAGERLYPSVLGVAGGVIASAVELADAALSGDFAEGVGAALSLGGAVVGTISRRAVDFADEARSLGQDATSVINLASQLRGEYGRYFNGGNVGAFAARAVGDVETLAELVAGGAAKRSAIDAARGDLTDAAAALTERGEGAHAVAAAASRMAGAVRSAAANPADGLRLLGKLAGAVL